MWMIENPTEGVCVPDDLPHDYVLGIAKPYLGNFISMRVRLDAAEEYRERLSRAQPARPRPARSVAVQELPGHGPQTDGNLSDDTQIPLQAHWPRNTARRCSSWTTQAAAQELRRVQAALPRVQAYYAVKANPDPAIVETFYDGGRQLRRGSMPEFMIGPREHQGRCRPRSGRTSSGTRSSTPIRSRPVETLRELDPTSRWSPTTTTRRSARSSGMRPTPGWPCGLRCPTPARWSSCRPSSGPHPARPWT